MIFSRLSLRPDALRDGHVRACLGRGAYGHHQLLTAAFFQRDADISGQRLLFRQESTEAATPQFLALSPNIADGPGSHYFTIEQKNFQPQLNTGDRLTFRIRMNPVVSRRGLDEQATAQRRGKRVDLIYDTIRKRQDATSSPLPRQEIIQQCGEEWLTPRLQAVGLADINHLRCDGYAQHRVRTGRKDIRFSSLDCDGIATVADPDAVGQALTAGIGPAKGFGCGMLVIRRV